MIRHIIAALAHPTAQSWRTLRPWQTHSKVLAVAGGVYIMYGIVLAVTPVTPSRTQSLEVLLYVAPLHAWGYVWIVVGMLALASTRWPAASKTWGYTALTAIAALWGAGYLVGVVVLSGPVAGLSAALIWLLMAYMWWAIAGLANPDDIYPARLSFEECADYDEQDG